MNHVLAYGSNMHLPDLARWLSDTGYRAEADRLTGQEVVPVRLPDHALVWDYRSLSRDGGAANVEHRAGAEVRGIALAVDDGLLAAIDRKEGHPGRYDRGTSPVPAFPLAGGAPLDVWLYRVRPRFREARTVPPRRAYLELLVQAATDHGLGDDYVAALRATPTAD